MPRKAAAPQPNPSTSDDDEWEEQIMVAQVEGVLDAQLMREAVENGKVNLRRAGTDNPILQIGNSLYTGHWSRTLGTHILMQAENQQLKIISVNSRMLKTEKALLTATAEESKTLEAQPSTSKSK